MKNNLRFSLLRHGVTEEEMKVELTEQEIKKIILHLEGYTMEDSEVEELLAKLSSLTEQGGKGNERI